MTDIIEMLDRRKTIVRAHDTDGSPLWARLDLTKKIASAFDKFDPIRLSLVHSCQRGKKLKLASLPNYSLELFEQLVIAGMLEKVGNSYYRASSSDGHFRYLTGGWLEEFTAAAAVKAGADQVLLSVEIEKANFPSRYNETDVIASAGGRLYFLSCKAYKTLPSKSAKGGNKLNKAAREIRLRCQQYGQRGDQAALITSVDLFKGQKVREPLERIFEFAKYHRVSVIGFEYLEFDALVELLKTRFSMPEQTGFSPALLREPVKLT